MTRTVVLYIILSTIGCTNSNETLPYSTQIHCTESRATGICVAYENVLQNSDLVIYPNGETELDGEESKLVFPVDVDCSIRTLYSLEHNEQGFIYFQYDCGPEGYANLCSFDPANQNVNWIQNKYFGLIDQFVIKDSVLFIAGNFSIAAIQTNTGELIWNIDIYDKYEFSNIKEFELKENKIICVGTKNDRDSANGWRDIELTINIENQKITAANNG